MTTAVMTIVASIASAVGVSLWTVLRTLASSWIKTHTTPVALQDQVNRIEALVKTHLEEHK